MAARALANVPQPPGSYLGCIAAGVLLSALYVLVRSPRYDANARIEVSPTGTNSMGLEDLPAKMLNPLDSTIQLQSAATILQSRTVALAVMQQMKLHERKDLAGRWTQPAGTAVANLSPEARDELLLRFSQALKVEIVPQTDIIDVQFRAKDPPGLRCGRRDGEQLYRAKLPRRL